jgi:crotonobetainyl-CoA:carnitine CoA-transferase CaiB-like acyl-CoA transferase
MPGVLDDLEVLDLSVGAAGPIAAMLMADHGARVTRIERPAGDPFGEPGAYRVWNRGKRSAVLDLHDERDHDAFLRLAEDADVVIESFRPGVTTRLGVDFETLSRRNPRLVYCSITGYGRGTRDAHRPGYDALVAARTGLHWEQRGWPGGAPDRLAGRTVRHAELEFPPECVSGALREGPLFPAVPWPSLAAGYLASCGISAALRARELTGRGQWVETSLLQGALAAGFPFQRPEDPDAAGYWTWVMDSRAPKGFFQCADGKWVLHWPMSPRFVLGVSAGDELRLPDGEALRVRDDPDRIGLGPDDMVVIAYYHPELAAAFRRFPSDAWVEIAAQANVALQPVRSPEDALADPALLADGCVVELEDPEAGPLRQVGRVYELSNSPGRPLAPASRRGEHTDAVRAAAAEPRPERSVNPRPRVELPSPLDGVTVLDLGLAVAGPFGTQILSDLGATVIKVNALHDGWWHATHIAMGANRGKRSIAMNLKDPRAMEALLELVKRADVVHHNMRYPAAVRLGIDEDSLRAITPDLIYCHTRGFEHGAREQLPGNDQTGGALAGGQWEDGGLSDGGRPIWSLTTLGDTGNGFLSAIGVLQALYHRERTGEGQRVDTSIIYAHLLNVSYVATAPDGSAIDPARLDAMQLGLSPRYRLYETGDGWLCLAALTDAHWLATCAALGVPPNAEPDAADAAFRTRPAAEWFGLLNGVGVPCEISSDTFALGVFDDPELVERGWVSATRHPVVGRIDMAGLGVDLSDTPGRVQGPPVFVGQESREILREIGYTDDRIDALCADGVVLDTAPAATGSTTAGV